VTTGRDKNVAPTRHGGNRSGRPTILRGVARRSWEPFDKPFGGGSGFRLTHDDNTAMPSTTRYQPLPALRLASSRLRCIRGHLPRKSSG
jgi:hypothetical protein